MSGPNEADEKDIILRAAQGDQEAFSVLYERYVRRIYSYIYYRTGNVHDAEDLTERVFHRALHHIRNFRYQGLPFSAWLYRIAHNLVPIGIGITSGARKYQLKAICIWSCAASILKVI